MRPKRTALSPLSTERTWVDARSTLTKPGRRAKVAVAAAVLAAASGAKAAEAGVAGPGSGANPAGSFFRQNAAGLTRPAADQEQSLMGMRSGTTFKKRQK